MLTCMTWEYWFTAFADTADYLYENISPHILQTHGLHSGKVTGSDAPRSTISPDNTRKLYDFQALLTLFSPRSKEKDKILPNEKREIDIFIGTDCISEGQNLQDCDYLINYDIHWNPVRIIQRFGRVDRIGSPNDQIQLVNYWPDISLDEYINLKERVENRMMIADVSATGDDNVLNAKANDVSYRREQLRKLQEEVIELEDVKAGVSITDLGLNDFRMDLLNYIKENGDLEHLPAGMHAVVPADEAIGLKPGIIFTLRNINPEVNINQQNRLHPFYLIYISNDGEVVHNHTEVSRISVMIINTQAFNASGADARRIYQELDQFGTRKPIDILAQTNPILIIDEPQSVDGEKTLKNMQDFNPLFTLRYSATHKVDYNKVFRLDALDAYTRRLVKKIQVKGINLKGSTGTTGYLYLEQISLSTTKPPYAIVEFEKRQGEGVKRVRQKLSEGSNLHELSGGIPAYVNCTITEINGYLNKIVVKGEDIYRTSRFLLSHLLLKLCRSD